MIIETVRIKHYRSIRELELSPKVLCGLIGPNNAGKTNILRAIEAVLGERWPTTRTFSEADYHGKDTSIPIEIGVTFVRGSTADDIESIKLEVPWDEKPEYSCIYRGNSKQYYVSAKVKEQVALVYVAAGRDLAKQLTVSSWTLLGRLMGMADSNLKEDAGRAKSLEDKLDEATTILKTDKFKEIEESLRGYTKEHMGQLPYSLELDFDIYNPINYYRSIQLLAREGGNTYDATELGSGLQNAIVLALFRTYAKLWTGTVTIAIEEPELFLHPHAQRMLHRLMKNLTAAGSQILYTTHSPHFVDIRDYESLALVRRTEDKGTYVCQSPHLQELDRPEKEFQSHVQFNPERSEMFFAQRVVLVEGETERTVLRHVARAMTIDLDDCGVSIVGCGNKHGITVLAPILNAFQIPFVVVYDRDPGDRRREEENVEIESLCPDVTRRFVLDPDLEGVLGAAKHLRPYETHKMFLDKAIDEFPKVFGAVVVRAIKL